MDTSEDGCQSSKERRRRKETENVRKDTTGESSQTDTSEDGCRSSKISRRTRRQIPAKMTVGERQG